MLVIIFITATINELNWIELSWIDLNWIELNLIELNRIKLKLNEYSVIPSVEGCKFAQSLIKCKLDKDVTVNALIRYLFIFTIYLLLIRDHWRF